MRVPASYCGILGLRPTHGRISVRGSVPLAPSFDAAGLFARDSQVLAAAAAALLDPASRGPAPALRRWLVGRDAFLLAEPPTAQAIYGALSPR